MPVAVPAARWGAGRGRLRPRAGRCRLRSGAGRGRRWSDAGRCRLWSGAAPSSRRPAPAHDGRCGGPGRPARIRFGERAGAVSAPRPARTRSSGRVAAGGPDRRGADRPAGAGSRGGVPTPRVGSRAAARWHWAVGVVARPGPRRGDPAAGGFAGRVAARCGVAAYRRRRSVADPGAAAGPDPGAPARSDPGLTSRLRPDPMTGGRRPAAPRLFPAPGAPPHAAARARATRRATPRSTAPGAGSPAARLAVRGASPGPTAAPRAGARSTSGPTSPSAQVVAPRSA
jgi:hypothetical protein